MATMGRSEIFTIDVYDKYCCTVALSMCNILPKDCGGGLLYCENIGGTVLRPAHMHR